MQNQDRDATWRLWAGTPFRAPAALIFISVTWAVLATGPGCAANRSLTRPSIGQAVVAARAQGFTGQVLVGDRRKLLFDKTVGMVRTPELWTWGSISKQVTAALVMMEVDRGSLGLDDPIERHLPEFPNPATRRVTVRQLLQHTSGLPNPDDLQAGEATPTFFSRQSADVGGPADALGFCAGPPKQPPGTFSYNNCDTIVLGAILERTSGLSFAMLLARRVSQPLRLGTVRLAAVGEHPVRARSATPLPDITLAAYGPAGAIVGSGRDLLRFDQALLTQKLVSAAATTEMWRGEPRLGYVALGAWSFAAPLAGCPGPVALVERRGAVDGIQSRNILAPALGRALVVLTDDADLEFGEIWQGRGLSYQLAAAAFCSAASP